MSNQQKIVVTNPEPEENTNNNSPKRSLTEKEAAEYLGLSHHTLRNWRYQGKGPVYCKTYGPNGRVRYLTPHLDDFQNAHIVEPM